MSDVNKEIALKVTADTGQANQAFANVEERLSETKKQLVEMAMAGKQNTAEFRKLAEEAGMLKGKLESVEQTVDGIGKSANKIEVFSGAVQGMAAGFAIAQGTAALFAEGNEELQESLIKVQASLALLQGTEQAVQLLRRESAVAQSLLTARTAAYNIVVGASTGALKVFRVALVSLGIGAVVVAIGALVANWDKLTAAVTGFIDKTPFLRKVIDFISDGFERLGRAIGIVPDATQKATEQMISDLEKQLELLKASGAETYAIEKRLAELRIQLAKQTGEGLADAEQELTLLVAAQNKERADKRAEEAKKQKEAALERYKQQREENKGLLENLKEFNREMQSERDRAAEERKSKEEAANEARMQSEASARMKEANDELARAKIREDNDRMFMQARIDVTKSGLQGIADLVSAFAGQGEEEQRRAFEFQKAAGISQAIIDGIVSTQAVFRNTPGGLVIKSIAAAASAAASLARIRAIANTQFQSASTSAAPQAIRPAGIPNTPTGAPQVFNPNTSTPNLPTNPQPSAANPQPLRAYVVDRDIEQGMARRNRLREFAGI